MQNEEPKKNNKKKYSKNYRGKDSSSAKKRDGGNTGGRTAGGGINKLYAILLVICLVAAAAIYAKEHMAPPVVDPAGTASSAESSGSSVSSGPSGAFDIPEYSGSNYAVLNNDIPLFTDNELNAALDSFEDYGKLDEYGRCTQAVASLSKDTMPEKQEERGDISDIHPAGWRRNQGWERMHLIAWNLSAENANERNLVTGTHYCNYDGMRPLEIKVADYILDTGNHVLYRVTPVYKGKDLIPSGILMEARSVEDDGRGIMFNVYVFNVTPGKNIDYVSGVVTDSQTGEPEGSSEIVEERTVEPREYVINKKSMAFHYPSCEGAKEASKYNKETVTATRQELIDKGYHPCSRCEP